MKFQGPAVTSVLLVTMATLNKPVVNAWLVSATTILTARSQSHVTTELASVSSASTTPKARLVLSVNWDTTGTLWHMTAGVSENSIHTSDLKTNWFSHCVYVCMC